MIQTQASGGVVIHDGKILVVSQNGNSWSLPKGHIDPGENPRAAAAREIHEESGVTQLTFIKKLGTYKRYRIGEVGGEDKSELKTITFFLYTTTENELNPIDSDNPEARWVYPNAVEALLTHPKDKAFFHRVMNEIAVYTTV